LPTLKQKQKTEIMKDDLKKLIASNQVEEAFNQLTKTIKNADLLNDLIIIQNNWWYLQSKSRRGLINLDEETKFRNKIINNILNIFDNHEIIDVEADNLKNSIPNEIKKVIRISPKKTNEPTLNKIIANWSNKILKKKDAPDSKDPEDSKDPKLQSFLLHLVEDNILLKIESPPSALINHIAKYIADYLFPHLRQQHFIWRLHYEDMKEVTSYNPLQLTDLKEETITYLTCEYRYSNFLPGNSIGFDIGGNKVKTVSR